MANSGGALRALHLYDCADVGATLVRAARGEGLPWSYLPARDASNDATGTAARVRRFGEVAAWTARRWSLSLPADLLHIHFGTRARIATRWPQRPFTVHFHGTDIREFYRDPQQRANVQWAADTAKAVFYATPDLAEPAREARPDARYLPNPVDLTELPPWEPVGPPRLIFASRWGAAKGGQEQLELAEKLAKALRGTGIRLEGLDWGENAARAAALGVRLVPTMGKQEYLRWLAGAHAVVGQSTGLLGMSELQAMGIGVPTAINVRPGLYPDVVPVVGVGGLDDQVESIVAAANDPYGTAGRLESRAWLAEHHDPVTIVRQLAAVYASIDA